MPRPRAALVTNADAGIGRATAIWLAERGFYVLACGTDHAAMSDLPRETGPGGVVMVREGLLATQVQCEAALQRLKQTFGAVDAVVATQDLRHFGPVEEVDETVQAELMEVNFYRPMRLFKAATPHLRRNGGGRLVCVTSAAGRLAVPMTGAYSASQYAIEGLCDALRLELSIFGIAVVIIEPTFVRNAVVAEGGMRTDPGEVLGVDTASPYHRLLDALKSGVDHQLRRASTPQDVATVVHRALTAARPKPRYAVTRRGAALLWAKKVLPERSFDKRIAKRTGLLDLDPESSTKG